MLRSLSHSLLFALALALPAVLPAVAHAQDKCLMPDGEMIDPIDNGYFQGQMDAAQKALDEYQLDDARYVLLSIRDDLRCLYEPARPTDVVRYARLMALMAFFDQDEMGATKWGFLASDTVPDMPWPADMAPNHPLRSALAWAEEPGASGPIDKVVVYPKKGLILMNGHPLTIPQAGSDVPNLVQVFDKKGNLVESYWQEGGAFKEEYLVLDDGKADEPELPKWYVGQDVKAAVERMKSDPAYRVDEAIAEGGDEIDIDIDVGGSDTPPPDPDGGDASVDGGDSGTDGDPDLTTVPPDAVAKPDDKLPKPPKQPKKPKSGGGVNGGVLGVGVGLGVVAGGMVGLAYLQEGKLDDGTTEAELLTARSRANQFVVGAGALGTVALGVGITALVMDDGAGLGLGWRW